MVTCNLTGGTFGNQLCIVAATIAYAHKHNMPYGIPPKTIMPQHWPVTHFSSQPQENHTGIHQVAYHPISNTWDEPANQSYKEIPYFENVCLNGMFQCYQYFQEYMPDIRKILGFPIQTQPDKEQAAIHVRRGDYMQFPIKHPTVTIGYLTRAIEFIVQAGYNNFRVFSDDIIWCKTKLTSDVFPDCTFEFMPAGPARQDFELMVNCQHQIISNSSYSMMAAHFNEYKRKIVIAPIVWSYEGTWNTGDLIPESWIKM
jgi:hypothetical protein